MIPLQYRIAIIAFFAVVGTLGLFAYGHRQYVKGDAAGAARIQAQFDAYKAQAQAQAIAARDLAIKAQEAAQAETERRIADQQEASRNHEKALDQARADAAAATSAVGKLQRRIAQLAAASGGSCSASGNPTAASVSTPAERLGAVASEAVSEYRALAEAARRGFLAGRECEADYEALKK